MLSTIPGTTPHSLVNIKGNVNSLGARSLVLEGPCYYMASNLQNGEGGAARLAESSEALLRKTQRK